MLRQLDATVFPDAVRQRKLRKARGHGNTFRGCERFGRRVCVMHGLGQNCYIRKARAHNKCEPKPDERANRHPRSVHCACASMHAGIVCSDNGAHNVYRYKLPNNVFNVRGPSQQKMHGSNTSSTRIHVGSASNSQIAKPASESQLV
jgi:hypothetical protein